MLNPVEQAISTLEPCERCHEGRLHQGAKIPTPPAGSAHAEATSTGGWPVDGTAALVTPARPLSSGNSSVRAHGHCPALSTRPGPGRQFTTGAGPSACRNV
jgi:hypothetical protein